MEDCSADFLAGQEDLSTYIDAAETLNFVSDASRAEREAGSKVTIPLLHVLKYTSRSKMILPYMNIVACTVQYSTLFALF